MACLMNDRKGKVRRLILSYGVGTEPARLPIMIVRRNVDLRDVDHDTAG